MSELDDRLKKRAEDRKKAREGKEYKQKPSTDHASDRTEPDTRHYIKNKFQIGKEFIEFYRATGDTGKVFIPADMLEKLTLLSVDSAKALMNGDD
jgi:hypothetical protein